MCTSKEMIQETSYLHNNIYEFSVIGQVLAIFPAFHEYSSIAVMIFYKQ